MIICGGSAYPREWDYARLRSIADKVGAYLLSDMAHIRCEVSRFCPRLPFSNLIVQRSLAGCMILCEALLRAPVRVVWRACDDVCHVCWNVQRPGGGAGGGAAFRVLRRGVHHHPQVAAWPARWHDLLPPGASCWQPALIRANGHAPAAVTSRPLLCILFWLHLACEDVSFASAIISAWSSAWSSQLSSLGPVGPSAVHVSGEHSQCGFMQLTCSCHRHAESEDEGVPAARREGGHRV